MLACPIIHNRSQVRGRIHTNDIQFIDFSDHDRDPSDAIQVQKKPNKKH